MKNLASDPNKDLVVFINDFHEEFAGAIQKLSKRLGRTIRTLVLIDETVKKKSRNVIYTDYPSDQVVCDFNDNAELRKTIKNFENNILLVTCSSERNQPYLKKVLPHVPYLPGPTESSLDWSTQKATMRKLLRSYDPHISPKSEVVIKDSDQAILKIITEHKFPMIVKPNGLASSILVKKVEDETELREALVCSFDVLDEVYSRDAGRGEPSMLVEEFIDGDMYSIDAYVNEQGKVWCLPIIKVTTADSIGKEGFYSYRLDTFHSLTDQEVGDAQITAEKAVHALGLRSSAAHIELFNSSHGWKIIELGPRAGGYRQDMYWFAYGIDHALNELMVKIGMEPEINDKPIACCSVFNLYADQEGIISEIHGVDKIQNDPSVKWIKIYKQPGDRAVFCGNGGKYIADGALSNESLDELNTAMARLRDELTVEVKSRQKIYA